MVCKKTGIDWSRPVCGLQMDRIRPVFMGPVRSKAFSDQSGPVLVPVKVKYGQKTRLDQTFKH